MKLIATVWFRSKSISSERLAAGFEESALAIHSKATVFIDQQETESSDSSWNQVIKNFNESEDTEEVIFQFSGQKGTIKGNIFFHIINPENLPSTIEFDITFDKKLKRKSKSYTFSSVDELFGFLHPICKSVSAICVWLEPMQLPDDIIEKRYRNFKQMSSSFTLTNPDWVFGLQSNDIQNKSLINRRDLFYKVLDKEEFTLYAISEKPITYSDENMRKSLLEIENAMGLNF